MHDCKFKPFELMLALTDAGSNGIPDRVKIVKIRIHHNLKNLENFSATHERCSKRQVDHEEWHRLQIDRSAQIDQHRAHHADLAAKAGSTAKGNGHIR